MSSAIAARSRSSAASGSATPREVGGDEQRELGGQRHGRRGVGAVPRHAQGAHGLADVAGEQLAHARRRARRGPCGRSSAAMRRRSGSPTTASRSAATHGSDGKLERSSSDASSRRSRRATATGSDVSAPPLDALVGGDRLAPAARRRAAAGRSASSSHGSACTIAGGRPTSQRPGRSATSAPACRAGATRSASPRRGSTPGAPRRSGRGARAPRPPAGSACAPASAPSHSISRASRWARSTSWERNVPGRLQRRRHELQPLELGERGGARPLSEQVVAERRGQPLERRRLEQEQLQLVGQPAEHVVGEEVPVRAAAPPDVGDRGPALARRQAVGGQVEQLQGGDPAAGAALELGDLVGRQRPLVQLAEQPVDLPRPEPQVVGADLAEARPEAQPGQVERRPVARQRHEVDRRRQVVEHLGEGPLARRPDDGVELVDDDEQPARRTRSRADERRRRGRCTGRRRPVARAIASPRCAASTASSPSTGWARYHTTSPPLRCTRWPAAVVLPAPAGPTTIVRGTSQARSSRRSTRSRTIARTAGGSNRARGSGRLPHRPA